MSRQFSMAERDEIRKLIERDHALKVAEIRSKDSDYENRVDERCRKLAIGNLNIAREMKQKQELEAKIATLQQQLEDVETAIRRKMPFVENRHRGSCPTRKDACSAISDIAAALRPAEVAKDATGRKIIELEKELAVKLRKLAQCINREDVTASGILN